MNLGQLIDPEWVQQGRPERFPLTRRANAVAQAPQVRTRTADLQEIHGKQATPREILDAEEPASPKPETLLARAPAPRTIASPESRVGKRVGGLTRAILTVLAASSAEADGSPMSEVRGLLGTDAPDCNTVVSAILSQLVKRGDVSKVGVYKSFRFKITEQGRARVT